MEEEVIISSAAAEPTGDPLRALIPDTDPNMLSLFADIAELNLWNLNAHSFEKQSNVVIRVAQDIRKGVYEYWLIATGLAGEVLAHKVSTDMNQRSSSRVLSFTWNHIDETGHPSSWCIRFESEELHQQFLAAMTQALWESGNQLPWGKAKVRLRMQIEFRATGI